MKKSLKIVLLILASILVLFLCAVTYYFIVTANAKLDDNKLINLDKTVSIYDSNLNLLEENAKNNEITYIEEIPIHVQKAFISIEDKRFYKHNGIDKKGLLRATFNNIKSFSFKEGASTISQQLIKNTHLSSEKKLNRKLLEFKLVKKLEKKYSKDEILEKYLNTIYFGNNCYGITKASKYYFGKEVKDLTIGQGAMLAGIIKAPSTYSPNKNINKCTDRRNLVLKKMLEEKYITNEQYIKEIDTPILLSSEKKNYYNVIDYAKNQLSEILDEKVNFSNKYNVYTSINASLQNIIEFNFNNLSLETDKSMLILDKNNKIKAYLSTCEQSYRQVGSTIKPLLVYAPAIEERTIYPYSIINDEKTDFNGYSPSNFKDKYLGNISIKEAVKTSSNVCAVKVLNYNGISKSTKYIDKTDIKLTKNDNSLCIALGATEKGATLTQICSAYNIFNNNGYYVSPSIIEKITDENGKIIYKNNKKSTKIFSPYTCDVINDILNETAKSGTAKQLSSSNLDLCAKTGTVGTKKGNTDAYSISYNTEYIVGMWVGNKDNLLISNNITGGGIPTKVCANVWKDVYKNKEKVKAYNKSNETVNVKLDKESYINGIIELADNNSPDRYTINFLASKNINLPYSTRFSSPTIKQPEISVNTNGILVKLCLAEYYNIRIYKVENGKKYLVYDTFENNKKEFIDKDVTLNNEYLYTVVPYYKNEQTEFLGKEIILPKIKFTPLVNEDWWVDN